MQQKITDETMEKIRILSQLSLTAEEAVHSRESLAQMLSFFDCLNELDTEGIDPLTHLSETPDTMREDTVIGHDGKEDAIKNAPISGEEGFIVPRTIG